jgi:hypothetical protein
MTPMPVLSEPLTMMASPGCTAAQMPFTRSAAVAL